MIYNSDIEELEVGLKRYHFYLLIYAFISASFKLSKWF